MFVKIKYGETILKLKQQNLTLADLKSKIRSSFSLKAQDKIELSYLDGEGDYVSVPSDEDLQLAIEESQKANPKGMASLLTLLVNHQGQDPTKKVTEEMLLGLMQSGGQKPQPAPKTPTAQKQPKPKTPTSSNTPIQVTNSGTSPLFSGALPAPPTINIALPPPQPQTHFIATPYPSPILYQPYPVIQQPYWPIYTPPAPKPRPPRPISCPTVRIVELCWKCTKTHGSKYWSVGNITPGSCKCFVPCRNCLAKAGIHWPIGIPTPVVLPKPVKPWYPHKYYTPCCR